MRWFAGLQVYFGEALLQPLLRGASLASRALRRTFLARPSSVRPCGCALDVRPTPDPRRTRATGGATGSRVRFHGEVSYLYRKRSNQIHRTRLRFRHRDVVECTTHLWGSTTTKIRRPMFSSSFPPGLYVVGGSAHKGAVHLSAMVLIVTYPQLPAGCGQHVGVKL
jgi:hypothetical protein